MQHPLRRLAAVVPALACVLAFAGTAYGEVYAGLGDSYSAGSGAAAANLNVLCTRNTSAYPYVVAQQRTDLSLNFQACGGAVTGDVINTQVPAMASNTGLVTITIGGNDVGFANLILGCITSSFTCTSAINTTNSEIADQLPAKLDAAYAAIKGKAPSAQVLVLGYPRVFNNRTCFQSGTVTLTEESQLNKVSDNLDATIKARATAAGFTYLDPTKAFAGHDVCSSSPYIWGEFDPWSIPFHPTALGHSAGYAAMVRSVIG